MESNLVNKRPPVALTSSGHEASLMCLVPVFHTKKVLLECIITADKLIITKVVTDTFKSEHIKHRIIF